MPVLFMVSFEGPNNQDLGIGVVDNGDFGRGSGHVAAGDGFDPDNWRHSSVCKP